MKVPLLDLKTQYRKIKQEIQIEIDSVIDSQYFILGPKVRELEENIAEYCRTNFAIGVSSGSDALIISLMAEGIGPGCTVITSPYTFFATAGSIARLGASPVFADIDENTYNISYESVQRTIDTMTRAERERIKAIIPVHLYGQCADMDKFLEIADAHHMAVIEDAAQAIGAEYKGRRAGSMGHYGCFSFFPSKNLGAFGDGGIVTAQKRKNYDILRILRAHGSEPKYFHKYIGGNFRLDALQAAVVNVKLRYLDQWTQSRQSNARRYRELFEIEKLSEIVQLPEETESRHIYNQFVIRVRDRRDELRQFLSEHEIGTEVYYPVPLHLQKCFSYLQHKPGDFPVSEKAALHTLAIPIYPELTEDQQAYVVKKIKDFFS